MCALLHIGMAHSVPNLSKAHAASPRRVAGLLNKQKLKP